MCTLKLGLKFLIEKKNDPSDSKNIYVDASMYLCET